MTNLLGSNHRRLCIESSAHNGARTKPAHHWKAFYYVMHPCSVMHVTCSSRLPAGWSKQGYCFLQSDKTPPHNFHCRHLYSEKIIYKVNIHPSPVCSPNHVSHLRRCNWCIFCPGSSREFKYNKWLKRSNKISVRMTLEDAQRRVLP